MTVEERVEAIAQDFMLHRDLRQEITTHLRAAAAEARREMGEEAAEAVESYEKWHGVNLTTLAYVIREVAKDPETPASSPSATRPERHQTDFCDNAACEHQRNQHFD